jgi:hypothetical protein
MRSRTLPAAAPRTTPADLILPVRTGLYLTDCLIAVSPDGNTLAALSKGGFFFCPHT